MSDAKRWLLPDGVEEILPAEAYKLESLRRQLLGLYESWGYQLVITPLIAVSYTHLTLPTTPYV